MKPWFLVILVMLAADVHARVEVLDFATTEQEQRYKNLINELRCLVCQNQNLADSNAELAKDLRDQTYTMIKSGSSDKEIIDYMVARYGDFVLYRPPLKPTTIVLWVGPFLILAVAMLSMIFFIRRRKQMVKDISDDDRLNVRQLIEDTPTDPNNA